MTDMLFLRCGYLRKSQVTNVIWKVTAIELYHFESVKHYTEHKMASCVIKLDSKTG